MSAKRPAPSAFTLVPVRISKESLPIVHKLAVAMTAEFDQAEEPFKDADVLQGVLEEGLIAAEKQYLGTNTLDMNEPEPRDQIAAIVRDLPWGDQILWLERIRAFEAWRRANPAPPEMNDASVPVKTIHDDLRRVEAWLRSAA
jgi:hypothetical protein